MKRNKKDKTKFEVMENPKWYNVFTLHLPELWFWRIGVPFALLLAIIK